MPDKEDERDPDFVRRVAENCGPLLRRYLAARLKAGEEPEDVAQDVYVRLLRLARTDLIRQPLAYVYFIAAQIVGENRLKKFRKPLEYTDQLEEVADTSHDSIDSTQHPGEVECDLVSLLKALDDKHRTVYLMRRRDGYSVHEISKQLGLNVFKVKRYLVEANATLSAKLGKKKS